MNLITSLTSNILTSISKLLDLNESQLALIDISLNLDKDSQFGDLSCNAAMVLARALKKNPRELAQTIQEALSQDAKLTDHIEGINIAGPGFLNITLTPKSWHHVARELFEHKDAFFKPEIETKNYLIEFVSANPTGPLHLGHGRGAIIGDTLARVLSFIGHKVTKEFYVNDAGNQVARLGLSLKARCAQELGIDVPVPSEGYAGAYLVDIAKEVINEHGKAFIKEQLSKEDASFFEEHATRKLLASMKDDLKDYGVTFDRWFSEKVLHKDSSVSKAIEALQAKGLAYMDDGALWFASTKFDDDKDRVIQKQDGSYTYIAADIAYHQRKFEGGADQLINIFGQDHHGYVIRLKATMQALGYDADRLNVILYQLVSIKKGATSVKMSKRAGTFTTLHEIIETVGRDVSRFFYLNRKAESHLDFDLDVALNTTEENPVFYIQYGYVRTGALLAKAEAEEALKDIRRELTPDEFEALIAHMGAEGITLLKKIVSLGDILRGIGETNQTHLLSYYVAELAKQFHNFYAQHRVIDVTDPARSVSRLLLVKLVRETFTVCFDLLGISKPTKM